METETCSYIEATDAKRDADSGPAGAALFHTNVHLFLRGEQPGEVKGCLQRCGAALHGSGMWHVQAAVSPGRLLMGLLPSHRRKR